MMKKIFIVLSIILSSCLTYAKANDLHWQFNYFQYEHTMNMVASVYIDGVEQQDEMLELGVFCGDDVRGAALPSYSIVAKKYVYNITLYSDNECELTFKLYNHNTDAVLDLDCEHLYTFMAEATEGTAQSPYEVNFTSPIPAVIFTGEGSWNNSNNWQNNVMPTADDVVVINGIAEIPGGSSIEIKSLSINSGKSLTINNAAKLTVTEKVVNTDADALIIEDGGQIIQTSENVAATFNKNIVNPTSWSSQKSGWQFVSSPMTNAPTEGFIPANGDYDLFRFDGTQELQWVNYKNHNDFEATFQQGVGYLASYEKQTTASFKGTLNNETTYYDFPISYNSSDDWANFHLLGNPFSFDIIWEEDMNYNARRMEDGFVTLNSTTGAYIYNVEGCIKVGEGFLICTSGKNPFLEYGEEAKSRNEKKDYINIVASNSDVYDNLIIRLGESESNGFPKLQNFNDEISTVYVKHENNKYGIFNSDANTTEIPVCFDANTMGNYTLTFDVNADFETLYLIDSKTGESINLLMENEYQFMAMSNDAPERFILKLDNGQQSTSNSNFAYINNGNLIVDAEGAVQIIDIMGRVVIEEENHDGIINVSSLEDATYIVRCVNENEVKTQKIVIL